MALTYPWFWDPSEPSRRRLRFQAGFWALGSKSNSPRFHLFMASLLCERQTSMVTIKLKEGWKQRIFFCTSTLSETRHQTSNMADTSVPNPTPTGTGQSQPKMPRKQPPRIRPDPAEKSSGEEPLSSDDEVEHNLVSRRDGTISRRSAFTQQDQENRQKSQGRLHVRQRLSHCGEA